MTHEEPLPEDMDMPDGAPNIPKLLGSDIELGNFILGMGASEDYRDACDEASVKVLRRIRAAQGTTSGTRLSWPGQQRNAAQGEWRSSSWDDDYGECSGNGDGNGGADRDRAEGRPTRRRQENDSCAAPRYRRYDAVDWGRSYLPANGGCCYIDQTHLELCTPEVLSAADHVAAWHAMLRIAMAGLKAANEDMPRGRVIKLLANNSDGKGNSYGSHINVLLTRRAWDNIFRRKLHHLLYLASFFASSVVYAGQGKVGAEEDPGAVVPFQLSQRADFFTKLMGHNTIFDRGMVNARNEALCGGMGGWNSSSEKAASLDDEMARLHIIIHDNTLCHGSTFLKVGVDQLLLAMIEAEEIDPSLILDDPVEALRIFSRDPRLKATARMATGRRLTAVELQLLFCERVTRFVEAGRCDGIVPDAPRILSLWQDTLDKLKAGDLNALVGRLDWILKLFYLTRARTAQPSLGWDAPQIKYLDQVYSSLDPEEGLYFASERGGIIERIVPESRVEHFTRNPPEDTRAWTRAMLLRKAGEGVQSVDWDEVKVRLEGRNQASRLVRLSNPLHSTRAHNEMVFTGTAALEDVLEGLGATVSTSYSGNYYYGNYGSGGSYGYGYSYGYSYGHGCGQGRALPANRTLQSPEPEPEPPAPPPAPEANA